MTVVLLTRPVVDTRPSPHQHKGQTTTLSTLWEGGRPPLWRPPEADGHFGSFLCTATRVKECRDTPRTGSGDGVTICRPKVTRVKSIDSPRGSRHNTSGLETRCSALYALIHSSKAAIVLTGGGADGMRGEGGGGGGGGGAGGVGGEGRRLSWLGRTLQVKVVAGRGLGRPPPSASAPSLRPTRKVRDSAMRFRLWSMCVI
ncbi:hypothetical protein EYF80_038481 [Liparis tanakae]|uniref:Uncharacterized protein n=1 Tax=Liparis tanakae TaxID=230148 RepID=A0A4Z2GCN1_9TELE|nr:hypothetical protein EYF80_038481 [Liparis tanakae]